MSDLVVSSVIFAADALEVSFMVLPDDVRADGQLVATRTYAVNAAHERFGEDVRDITQAVTELAQDVHVAFAQQPLTTAPPAGEDDAEGMGTG